MIQRVSARLLAAACAAALVFLPTQLHAEKPEATEAPHTTVRLLTLADARRIVDATEARAAQLAGPWCLRIGRRPQSGQSSQTPE